MLDFDGRDLWRPASITMQITPTPKIESPTIQDSADSTVDRRSGRRANVATPDTALPLLPRLEGGRRHNVIVVGLNRRSRRYLEGMQAYQSKGVRVVCVIDTEGFDDESPTENQRACLDLLETMEVPHLGTLEILPQILVEYPIDEVHVTLPMKSCYDDIDSVLSVCDEAGVPASLTTDLFESGSASMSAMGNLRSGSQLRYSCVQRTAFDRFAKRSIDVIGSIAGLIVFAIPMLLIALIMKLTSRGPVLFPQERFGMNHRPFTMYKFRTMVVNAEQLRQQLEQENEMDGPVFKMRRDPRITAFGRFLRKSSLDELPQLFNVLKGEMSLVGPRPPIGQEVREYEWWQRRRLSTRPGLTCYWQISGRNQIDFEEWMRLDLRYIDDWSIRLDLKLILLTIPAVLFGRGAS